jgi:hypothetical protein
MADETSTPSKPRGRPPAKDPLSYVGTRLPPAYHDRLIQLAKHQEKSVSALVRDLLTLRLR